MGKSDRAPKGANSESNTEHQNYIVICRMVSSMLCSATLLLNAILSEVALT